MCVTMCVTNVRVTYPAGSLSKGPGVSWDVQQRSLLTATLAFLVLSPGSLERD